MIRNTNVYHKKILESSSLVSCQISVVCTILIALSSSKVTVESPAGSDWYTHSQLLVNCSILLPLTSV
jgi:hypothetical protein